MSNSAPVAAAWPMSAKQQNARLFDNGNAAAGVLSIQRDIVRG